MATTSKDQRDDLSWHEIMSVTCLQFHINSQEISCRLLQERISSNAQILSPLVILILNTTILKLLPNSKQTPAPPNKLHRCNWWASSSFDSDWCDSSRQGDIHEDFCAVCRRSGQLLMCDTCSRVYHLDCLDPPLKTIPKGMWICPKCHDQVIAYSSQAVFRPTRTVLVPNSAWLVPVACSRWKPRCLVNDPSSCRVFHFIASWTCRHLRCHHCLHFMVHKVYQLYGSQILKNFGLNTSVGPRIGAGTGTGTGTVLSAWTQYETESSTSGVRWQEQ